jgi:hypothetical protein
MAPPNRAAGPFMPFEGIAKLTAAGAWAAGRRG